MRITNKMLVNHSMSNLNGNMKRLDKINEQLSSGKKIQKPSDDPVGTTVVMRMESSLKQVEQFKANVDYGVGMLESADSALGQLGDILQRARELAVYGANGTLDDESKSALADEVGQLLDHAVQVGNTTFAGRHIFAYNQTKTPPFEKRTNGAGTDELFFLGKQIGPDGTIAKAGVSDKNGIEVGVQTTVDVRVPGDEAFGPGLAMLVELKEKLVSGDPGEVIDDLDQAIDQSLRWRSEAGAKMKRLEITEQRLMDLEISTKSLISKTEDIDVAETVMNLKMEENAYRLALNSGAKIIQPTLMDFLR